MTTRRGWCCWRLRPRRGVANARTHRDERQARADLAALVEITPVGVVVFEVESGRLASLNREARRVVGGLRTPGHPPEQLLETITIRRADGRMVSLGELPLVQLLGTGETVRAEEVVLAVPDGPSVRTLINATPIRAEGGAIRSVVVTQQDSPTRPSRPWPSSTGRRGASSWARSTANGSSCCRLARWSIRPGPWAGSLS